MRSIDFGAFEYMDSLKESGIPQEQAEMISKGVVKMLQYTLDEKEIATKNDIKELALMTKNDISELKLDLQSFMMRLAAWIIGISGTVTGIIVGISHLFMK